MENLKSRLFKRMREYFNADEKRISHALRVTEYAERILQYESNADRKTKSSADEVNHKTKSLVSEANRDVVIAAAILHDIGIHEAERKYGSSAGKYQEIEGPPIAREIMFAALSSLASLNRLKKGLHEELVEEVCSIIAHHHTPGIVDTNNFRIVYDADLIVNMEDRELSRGKFLTGGGRKVAAADAKLLNKGSRKGKKVTV